jgi:hypothetical protein
VLAGQEILNIAFCAVPSAGFGASWEVQVLPFQRSTSGLYTDDEFR